jgi:hypothetical protein
LKERTTPDFRNTPSTTNLEEEEFVDAPGNDGKASMSEQVKRPNPWRKIIIIIITDLITLLRIYAVENLHLSQTVSGLSFSQGKDSSYYYYYYIFSCYRPFLPVTAPLEPTAIPTAQASSSKLQHFLYYV